ncbi:MAG: type III-A CRISPR-associated RAMP protein Csm3 [Armatimonadota bacterium]|nr:type III-A CRISPR-associated RAMP protein Csm3 [Armatimonadota bacterium]MDR7437065.1 type III-A CRISPR-associated RAMP protein Csm3 [Armatimonadota bacterium]MDR7472864.1 type III-A CRISPR-associated RAMP protein Csm3 [Armatimonadota bacterium]MDR7507246.1 type III-A CRISPR-associated RAMP protein Csm3 [Armatimonadota bacterium]MDR7508951.1 type III-A CRISPR-associated RAMP protein Csm3 [Armatimonadota bacterium]
MKAPQLLGKVVLTAELKALTGLRIGAATSGIEIGGLDNPVLRDPITEVPYIPGSSLKGKLRSLLTKAYGLELLPLGPVRLHWCEDENTYRTCPVCPTFGQFPAGPRRATYPFVTPARLAVRDARLLPVLEIEEGGQTRRVAWDEPGIDTDLPYTEVKVEVALDVVTAASNPRPMERVPAGALFNSELLFNVYRMDQRDSTEEKEHFRKILVGMRLLEDDYLGSSGTRGYGKVKFQKVRLSWRPLEYYRNPSASPEQLLWEGDDLSGLLSEYDNKVAAKVWGGA